MSTEACVAHRTTARKKRTKPILPKIPNRERKDSECLNDENDGNGSAVDAIVYDYELFMLFHQKKKVLLKLEPQYMRELHEKPITNICTVWTLMGEETQRPTHTHDETNPSK